MDPTTRRRFPSLVLAFLVGVAACFGCVRLSVLPSPAPAPAEVTITFVIQNAMPVSLNVFLLRPGWADVQVHNRIAAWGTDTVVVVVPQDAAFRLLLSNPEHREYWVQSSVIFALEKSRFHWQVLPPLYLRKQANNNGR